MRRREFIAGLGGVAAWPLVARAQERERMRRIGVLTGTTSNDLQGQKRIVAFHQALAQLGWEDGRNVRIDTRWVTADADDIRKQAAELGTIAPDVVLTSGAGTVAPLLQ